MSSKHSSCDTVTDELTSKAPLRYPVYLKEPVTLTLDQDYDEKGIVIQSDVEPRIPFHERFDGDLLKNGSSVEKIVEVLLAANCRLGDVIRLENVELTRAFLTEKLSTSCDESERHPSWTDPYSLIDADTRDSVDQVVHQFDLRNAELILTYGPDRDLRRRHFFYNLVSMAMERRNLKALNVFLNRVVKWNILDKEAGRLIEHEVFQKASKDVVGIFLQNRLDIHIEKLCGHNALAALCGNRAKNIGPLKRKKNFNVNAAGFGKFTALHYAMKKKHFKAVKFLLDRGADINATTAKASMQPLILALWKPAENPIDNEKCVELMLQYGANPFAGTGYLVAFCYCINARLSARGHTPFVYAQAEHLTKLTFAYICMYDAPGVTDSRPEWANSLKLFWIAVKHAVKQDDDLMNFYRKVQPELQTLKQHEIRRGLTMLTVASTTGEHLFRLVNREDEKTIASFIDKYNADMTIDPYYVSAMREHMRQYRKLVAHKNRAMLVISANAKALASCFVVLNKIASYLTYKDLLMFQ